MLGDAAPYLRFNAPGWERSLSIANSLTDETTSPERSASDIIGSQVSIQVSTRPTTPSRKGRQRPQEPN